MKVTLQDIADATGVSVKTVSGALHGKGGSMAAKTRERIHSVARDLGYVPNLAARAMRQGFLPIIGIVSDGLLTSPYATDIMRSFDTTVRAGSMSVIANNIGGDRDIDTAVSELERFIPRAIAYAAMYHKVVDMPERARGIVRLMIDCRDAKGVIPSVVPAEHAAAATLVTHLLARGRRRLGFLNLPGLLAGELRAEGFRAAHAAAGIPLREDWIRPATKQSYSDRAHSLAAAHLEELMSGPIRPDAIICGNDRVAFEAYNALRRLGLTIPDDIAVASFDNQVDIASRLDPPLTTMALPHRAMGRIAAEILLGNRQPQGLVEEIPFHLVERASC